MLFFNICISNVLERTSKNAHQEFRSAAKYTLFHWYYCFNIIRYSCTLSRGEKMIDYLETVRILLLLLGFNFFQDFQVRV